MALHPQLDKLISGMLPIVQDFHRNGMFAPHAATIDRQGDLFGHALVEETEESTASQAIEHFESKFGLQARRGEIQASGIFYHSPGIDASDNKVFLPPASTTDECKAIVALLEHSCGNSVYLFIPYSGQPPQVEYDDGQLIEKPPKVFIPKTPFKNERMWRLYLTVFAKYMASFFKRDWTIDDYPVQITHLDTNMPFGSSEFAAWQAKIARWDLMGGSGDTRDEAIANLTQNFNEYKRYHEGTLPRPGTRVAVEFASTDEIDQYSTIASDFFEEILEMDFDTCFVSDESSLWDFPNTSDKARVLELVKQTYQVDISDIETGNLVQIFQRLDESSSQASDHPTKAG